MDESRKNLRVRAMLGAQIIFNNRSSTIDCQIRNISAQGAKIIVDQGLTFPQQFDFFVPHKARTFQARVIWRHGDETGVEFVNETVAGHTIPTGEDMNARLRELEIENARLRKRVNDLQSQVDRHMQTA